MNIWFTKSEESNDRYADGLNRLKHTDQESQKRKQLFFNLSSQNKVFVIGIKKNIRKEAF